LSCVWRCVMAELVNVVMKLRAAGGGEVPMLMKSYDVDANDVMKEWKEASKRTKDKSVPGDDRTPPWRWTLAMYSTRRDGAGKTVRELLALPRQNLIAAMVNKGATFEYKQKLSCKHLATTGMVWLGDPDAVMLVDGKEVDVGAMKVEAKKLEKQPFEEQYDVAKRLGHGCIALDVRGVGIGKGKDKTRHVRVRPRISRWSAEFQALIEPDLVDTLTELLRYCGSMAGLGDWRPAGPTPGVFGKFDADVEVVGGKGAASGKH
jgi:hypothetical protein